MSSTRHGALHRVYRRYQRGRAPARPLARPLGSTVRTPQRAAAAIATCRFYDTRLAPIRMRCPTVRPLRRAAASMGGGLRCPELGVLSSGVPGSAVRGRVVLSSGVPTPVVSRDCRSGRPRGPRHRRRRRRPGLRPPTGRGSGCSLRRIGLRSGVAEPRFTRCAGTWTPCARRTPRRGLVESSPPWLTSTTPRPRRCCRRRSRR